MSRWTAWALVALVAFCLGVLAYCGKKGATLSPDAEAVRVKTLNSASETLRRGGEVTLTVTIVDGHNRPVAGREVTFSATSGTVPTSAVTDENGVAVVTFQGGSAVGTTTVTARVGEHEQSIQLRIIEAGGVTGQYRYVLSSDVESILADGLDCAEIRATVTDTEGRPKESVHVAFSTTAGTLSPSVGVTDAQGVAYSTLISVASSSDTIAQVTAIPDTSSAGKPVGKAACEVHSGRSEIQNPVRKEAVPSEAPLLITFRGVTLEVVLERDVMSTGGEHLPVTATLKETTSHIPLVGVPLRFGTSLGTIVGTDTTDASGVARSTLISEDVPGTATVIVTYGPAIRETISVEIAPVRGEDPTSIVLVSAQPAAIGVKGSGDNETASIVFEVTDAYGMTVQDDTPILFTLAGGIAGIDASLSPDTAWTVDGRASATLQSGTRAGTVKVVATSAVFPDVSSGAVSVAVHGGPPDEDHFSLAAGKLNIAGKRFSGLEVLITAYVFDQYSNPVPSGTSISFQTTGGGIEGSAVTNEYGTATVKMISAKPWPDDGFATVTAQTVGRDTLGQDAPIEAEIQVLFSGPTAPILVDPSYITVPDGGRQAFTFFVGDERGNPLVEATKIRVTATGGLVTGDVDVTLPDTQSKEATQYDFIFEDQKGETASSQVKIEVTSPNGDRAAVITAAPPSPLSVQLTADPQTVWADGASTATLTAMVVDMAGYPIPGQTVAFITNTRSLPWFAVTDAAGRAEVVWTSIPSTDDLSVPVIAQVGDLTDTTTVTLQGVTLTVDTAQPAVLADGVSAVEITAQYARTTTNAPIVGQTVRFTAFDDQDEDGVQDAGEETIGMIGASGMTGESGQAKVMFTGEAGADDRRVRIRATLGGLSDTTSVQLLGVTLAVTASSTQVFANGTDRAMVTARLTESASGAPIQGKAIQFASTLGTLSNGTGMTNANGEATVELTGGMTPGTATVTATYGMSRVGSVDLEVVREASIPTTLTLVVIPAKLVADHRQQAEIIVTVTDQNGHPVPDGTGVRFDLDPPEGTLSSTQASTVDGIALNTLTSGDTPGTVALRAWIQGDSSASVRETGITYLVGPAVTVTVTADTTELPADGITSTTVRVTVKDVVGNPVPNVEVAFASNIGNVTASASTDGDGGATARFSSDVTGTAIVTATVAGASGSALPIFVHSGPPHSILLSYDPTLIGVRGIGRNATLIVSAEVRDSHGNSVADGTEVAFFIVASPSKAGDVYRDELSTTDPVPTVNGIAQVSFTSGSRSGTARIGARLDEENIEAVSTEFQIFSGPPYIEDPNNPSPDAYEASSHLAIGAGPINILGWNRVNNRTSITVVAGDKYNNPVPEGTTVYFTTTGGIAATATGVVDENGVATVTLITGAPFPTVDRYGALLNPNMGQPIPGDPADFDLDGNPNDGIARVLATSEGVGADGYPAVAWSVCDVIFSGAVEEFSLTKNSPVDTLWIGGWAGMTIRIADVNGNPIVPGSNLTAETTAGALSWTSLTTGDPGSIEYGLSIGNGLSPRKTDEEREFKPALVTVKLNSANGTGMGTLGFVLVNEEP